MADLLSLATLATIFDDLARLERVEEQRLTASGRTVYAQGRAEGYRAAMADVRHKLLEYYGRKVA